MHGLYNPQYTLHHQVFFIAYIWLSSKTAFFPLRTRSVCPSGHRCSSVMVIVMVPRGCLMSLHPPGNEPPGKTKIVAGHFPTHQFARAILDSLALLKVFFFLSTMVHHHFAPPSRKYIYFSFSKHQTRKSKFQQYLGNNQFWPIFFKLVENTS